jgi:hypothetical protein
MRISRRPLKAKSWLGIALMLFVQVVSAAQGCGVHAQLARVADQVQHCDHGTPAAKLCQAHCAADRQSSYHAEAPQVAALLDLPFVRVEPAKPASRSSPPPQAMRVASRPLVPIPIRFCSLLI